MRAGLRRYQLPTAGGRPPFPTCYLFESIPTSASRW